MHIDRQIDGQIFIYFTWASCPERSPKNMIGKRTTENRESVGKASPAVNGVSGRVRTAAANASAVAICKGTAVLNGGWGLSGSPLSFCGLTLTPNP